MIGGPRSCALLLLLVPQFAVAQAARHRAVLPSSPSQSGLTLDQSRAATGSISTDGGSLSATAADGTRFTLTVPAGAFLSDEDITMIPVAAMTRLPFSGGLRAGVQLRPEGLRLQQPATLTIDAAQPLSLTGQKPIAFGYHGDGDALHLFPAVVSGSHAELVLMHFSGYGVGSGTDGDVQAQQQRTPASAEDRAEQDMAAGLERFAVLQAWWAGLVNQLIAAGSDALGFDIAFNQFLVWQNLALSEPLALPLIEQGWALVNAGLINSLQQANLDCIRDPSRLLHFTAIAQRPELRARGSDAIATAAQLIPKCLRFELQFDSEMIFTSESLRYDTHVKSTVTFRMELGQNGKPIVIPASGPLEYVSFSAFVGDCSTQTQTTGSTFTITNDPGGTLSRIEFPLNFSPDPYYTALEGRPTNITLTIDHGGPVDRLLSITCPNSPPQPITSVQNVWQSGWTIFHGGLRGENEAIAENQFQIRNWDFLGGRLFAQKVYSRSATTEPVVTTEMTTLKLFHTPVP